MSGTMTPDEQRAELQLMALRHLKIVQAAIDKLWIARRCR